MSRKNNCMPEKHKKCNQLIFFVEIFQINFHRMNVAAKFGIYNILQMNNDDNLERRTRNCPLPELMKGVAIDGMLHANEQSLGLQ